MLLIASPVGAYGTKKVDDYQSALLKDKDDRISIVQEAIHGIRILKVCEICYKHVSVACNPHNYLT